MIKFFINGNLLIVLAMLCPCVYFIGCSSGSDYRREEFSDFVKTTKSGGGSFQSRLDSVDKLYRSWDEGGEAWIVLILSEPIVLDEFFSKEEDRDIRFLADARNQILTHLIEAIENDAPPSILWALTLQLTNKDRIRIMFGEQVDGIWVESVEHTESVRNIARSKLQSIFGEDHEYSVGAWRTEIVWRYMYTAAERKSMAKPVPYIDYLGEGVKLNENGQK